MITKNDINNNNISNNSNTNANTSINNRTCLTIGRIAPDFTAITTQGPITMSSYRGKWVLFFSHPGDFTPVIKVNYYCI